jgi:hypothetical protein
MTEPAGELPSVRFPEDDNLAAPTEPGDGADRGRTLAFEPEEGEEVEYA